MYPVVDLLRLRTCSILQHFECIFLNSSLNTKENLQLEWETHQKSDSGGARTWNNQAPATEANMLEISRKMVSLKRSCYNPTCHICRQLSLEKFLLNDFKATDSTWYVT